MVSLSMRNSREQIFKCPQAIRTKIVQIYKIISSGPKRSLEKLPKKALFPVK